MAILSRYAGNVVESTQAVAEHEINWAEMELPKAWPDEMRLRNPVDLVRLLRRVADKRRKVHVPEGLPGAERIPHYVLQEFHHLPNGNYSDSLTRGYIKGFDLAMLGEMYRARRRIAEQLAGCRSVVDIGCAGGRTAAAIKAAGVDDVWGVEPSPYLLRHAARDHPGIRFRQGVLEALPFEDGRFDGAALSFVLHEIPPHYMRQGLAQLARVLRHGGLVAVGEPSPTQASHSFWQLLRSHGLKGGYFRLLMRSMHEPFIAAWHRLDFTAEAERAGFTVLREEDHMPIKHWLLRLA